MQKILIVEDDNIILSMYKIKFTNAGYEVLTARDGVEGLKLMKSSKPNLVIMDLMMPNMDGFTALQNAKSDSEIKDIPIVIVTNLSQNEDEEKTRKLGAADFLVKSEHTPGEILEKIKKYI